MAPSTLLSSFSRLSLNSRTCTSTSSTLNLNLTPTTNTFTQIQIRHASHASQGVANGAKQGPGKRLGAKKGSTELVVPGNIIFRQRGSHWFPGENCVMGRDHTISALVKGYVRYYLDPSWPGKKFIGVVMDQAETLPRRHGVPRRRRVGMEARPMAERDLVPVTVAPLFGRGRENAVTVTTVVDGGEKEVSRRAMLKDAARIGVGRKLKVNMVRDTQMRRGYQVRESNWSIGRTVEREGVFAKTFDRKNRWRAWRERVARAKKEAETRVAPRAKSGKGADRSKGKRR